MEVVGHEHLLCEHELHNGVTSRLYVDRAVNGYIWLYILISQGYVRKGAEHVHRGNCGSCFLHRLQLCCQKVPDLRKNIRFKGKSLVLGAQYSVLGILQILGDEALGIGKSLLAYPALGDKVVVGARYLKIVSEHSVEAYLQVLYARGFLFLLLYFVDYAPSVVHDMAEIVQFLVEALLDNAAVLYGYGRLVRNGVLHKVHQLVKSGYLLIVSRQQL